MMTYRESIELIGPREAGPHAVVLDTVHSGPHPEWDKGDEHVLVVCQDCDAEWPEGGDYPEECGLRRENLMTLIDQVEIEKGVFRTGTMVAACDRT